MSLASTLKSPIGGAAVGGGVSALTQVALKLAIKLDAAKPADDQKLKLFAYRHAGLVGLLASAAVAGVYYFGLKQKSTAYVALAAGAAASLPGIVSGIKAAQAQKALGTGWNASMGTPVAEPRSNSMSGTPGVQVFGSSRSDIQLMGPGDGSATGSFNAASFGGGSF